jgi:hypothetical protein
MWSNHPTLKVKDILTMSINSIRLSMGLSKHQKHGMDTLGTFLLKLVLGLVRPILLSSLKMSKNVFVCQIYVDDIIFSSTNKFFFDEFSKIMTDRFEMSMMRVITFFLAFQIKQVKHRTFISQTKYTRDILKKFSMNKAKSIKTPMGTNGYLNLDLGGTSVDQKVYRSMIRSLLYLYASRPDIMLSVCTCARF